jgi:hypothetical protein
MTRVNAGAATIQVKFANFAPETVQDHLAPPTYDVEVAR